MMSRARFLGTTLLYGSLLCLAGCNDGSGDPKAQIGSNPTLPELQQYLVPPMHIAKVVGWKKGETPKVAQGLKIEPLATGLQHPRSLYTLPNGDVLVVESKAPPAAAIKRPKEIIMGYIESWATSGGNTGGEQPHHPATRYQWRWHPR
jgi:glucose/arabinose dehydrogenase